MTRYDRIYSAVRRIPKGKVASYGHIARLAGIPRHARQVGYALSHLSDDRIPWQRVVNAKGEISARSEPYGKHKQRALLEREGIVFDDKGRIPSRFRMKPGPVRFPTPPDRRV